MMSDEPTSEVLGLQRRVTQLEEELVKRDHRLSLATTYDKAKGVRIKVLEAEIAEWRKLEDSELLLASLVQGVPAALDRAQAGRLLMSRPIQPAP